MALKMKVKLGPTVEVSDAYHRLDAVRFDQPTRLWVQIGAYESEAHANADGAKPLSTIEREFVVDAFGGKGNIDMAAIYTLLKDEFTDAVDA